MSGTTVSLELYTCTLDVRGLKSSRVTRSPKWFSSTCCALSYSVELLDYKLQPRGIVIGFPAGQDLEPTCDFPKRLDLNWDPPHLRGVKRLGNEANHSPHVQMRVTNEWSYTSTLTYAVMSWTGTILPFIFPSLQVKRSNSVYSPTTTASFQIMHP